MKATIVYDKPRPASGIQLEFSLLEADLFASWLTCNGPFDAVSLVGQIHSALKTIAESKK